MSGAEVQTQNSRHVNLFLKSRETDINSNEPEILSAVVATEKHIYTNLSI